MIIEKILAFVSAFLVCIASIWALIQWLIKKTVESKFKEHETKLNNLIEINRDLVKQRFQVYEKLDEVVYKSRIRVRDYIQDKSDKDKLNGELNILANDLESTMASGRFHLDGKVFDKVHEYKLFFQGLIADINSCSENQEKLVLHIKSSFTTIDRLYKEFHSLVEGERKLKMNILV
jgi:hypothetical protein